MTRRTIHSIKVLASTTEIKTTLCVKQVLAVVTEIIVKNLGLAGSSEWVGRFTPSWLLILLS